jgi:hypothetical protein
MTSIQRHREVTKPISPLPSQSSVVQKRTNDDRYTASTVNAPKATGPDEAAAKRIMDRMADVAEAYSRGKRPDGKCLMHVQNILEANNFPGAKVGRLPYARNFAEKVDAAGPEKYGLQKIQAPSNGDGTVDLTKVPPGAIIVVAPGSPGTRHPTAGDIVIKGKGPNDLFNGGEMGYAGRNSSFPANKVLGIYVPNGANVGEVDFQRTTEASSAAAANASNGGTFTYDNDGNVQKYRYGSGNNAVEVSPDQVVTSFDDWFALLAAMEGIDPDDPLFAVLAQFKDKLRLKLEKDKGFLANVTGSQQFAQWLQNQGLKSPTDERSQKELASRFLTEQLIATSKQKVSELGQEKTKELPKVVEGVFQRFETDYPPLQPSSVFTNNSISPR